MASAPGREGSAKPPAFEPPPQRITRDLRPAKSAEVARGVPYTTKG
jgi:hypothetical protein